MHDKLHARPPALQVFLGLVLSTAAFWNPEKMQEARAARSDLANVNQQIARKAAELALLLEQRSDLHDTSGFSSDAHYHVCGVIEAASQHNYLFQSYDNDIWASPAKEVRPVALSCCASSHLRRLAPFGLPSFPRSARLTPPARLPDPGLRASLAVRSAHREGRCLSSRLP
ncbi:hypothetical protein ACM7F7_03800 [Pseudomonas aeruginosa]